ncbi:hypothetical protein ACE1ET_20190 [Saccharicrinis sp. FJH62]|uniref:hypothetical protein n=1 Tax=Saccharicrinis sp. FJH62 TaxID=3344657 RepID=UPI0035D41CB1
MNENSLNPELVNSFDSRQLIDYVKKLIQIVKSYPVKYENKNDFAFIAGVSHHLSSISHHKLIKDTEIGKNISDESRFNETAGYINIGKIICELNNLLFYLISNHR